jgi:hypothetical protein
MSFSFSIKLVTYSDVPALAAIAGDSFEMDRHTQMKGLVKKPFNMYEVALEMTPRNLASERCVMMKAVDDATGEVLGSACWGFRGFEIDEIPRTDPGLCLKEWRNLEPLGPRMKCQKRRMRRSKRKSTRKMTISSSALRR